MDAIGLIELAALRSSGDFDAAWYQQAYPDVAMSGMDPGEHFLKIGKRLGRRPGPRGERGGGGPRRLIEAARSAPWRAYRPIEPLVRFICFHLPQFHSIAENDHWWGEGFTEWTNVRPAVPQFPDHYQPHEPHPDIGYYRLDSRETLARQVEMARNYGIGGFCFYHYWFGGKRLLERPVDLLLENPDLDVGFCLCWANENWTRRWDGLDQDVLIAQKHSAEDDIAFIADLARYIRDARYIRVNGRPLVLVYRPDLLPLAIETTNRWRTWCREAGLGEIYLAFTESFESSDPADYGFDAAVAFPPNNASPPDLTATLTAPDAKFSGNVFDWRVFVERSFRQGHPGYKRIPAVNPGWDNTARKRERANVFVGNEPALYQTWLENEIARACTELVNDDEKFVFCNAWNEWGEGAHLEPDRRHGYAYLEATRNALAVTAAGLRVAIVVHVFYPELLEEILERVALLPARHKLFVSTVAESAETVRRRLDASGRSYRLVVVENRGRDVLPLLELLSRVIAEGFDLVAKVHTKRSLHRDDGDSWRDELLRTVIGASSFHGALAGFAADPKLGMAGPEGHFVRIGDYIGSNRDRVGRLAARLGIAPELAMTHGFFAGTMFLARTAALAPLLELEVSASDFEDESRQIDGTMAHVLERVIGLGVAAGGYRLAFTTRTELEASISPDYGYA